MNLKLTNKSYDFLNALVRIILPALGTFYFTLSQIWGMPYATEVVGTIAAMATFFGLVILLARNGWQVDEELIIDARNPEELEFGFKNDPRLIEHLEDGQQVTLRVNQVTGAPEDYKPSSVVKPIGQRHEVD